jgi:RNA polymerase sigma-70 factor (ECF subfamily)
MRYKSSTSDQDLIHAYVAGDEGAFNVLLRRHQSKIYGKIYNVVKDSAVAEDVFQDALMKAVVALKSGSYNEEGKFVPWVMRIAHNLCIDYFRNKKKIPITRGTEDYDPLDYVTDNHLNREESAIRKEMFNTARELMMVLPDEQREIVIMRLYLDMSFKEIAEKLDISINTALGRMRYALLNLRKYADDHHVVIDMECL